MFWYHVAAFACLSLSWFALGLRWPAEVYYASMVTAFALEALFWLQAARARGGRLWLLALIAWLGLGAVLALNLYLGHLYYAAMTNYLNSQEVAYVLALC